MFKSKPMFYMFYGLSLAFAIVTGIYGMYVFLLGGDVGDFSAVCAFGATACSFGILARLEQAAMHNNTTWEIDVQPNNTSILEQTSEATVDPKVCIRCGNPLEKEDKFCIMCGNSRI